MTTRNTPCQHGRDNLEVTDAIAHFGSKSKIIGKEYKCTICGYIHSDTSDRLLSSLVSDDGRQRGGQLPDRVDLEKHAATDSDWNNFDSARRAG
ncbi:hypothetical protein Xoosp14_82 [Xanthomonas phage Xoo-sp14]|nr:hypothetical protein Xoosp14_82 [Xanthomonas phage Xoo-sp14]